MVGLSKRYLLATADAAFSAGLLLVWVPCIFLGLLVSVVRFGFSRYVMVAPEAIAVVFVAGLIAGAIQAFIKNQNISTVDDFADHFTAEERPDIMLIKIDSRGRVVDFGRKVWGRDGVFFCKLPAVADGMFSVSVPICYALNGVTVEVGVTLTAFLRNDGPAAGAFLPQELYDLVVSRGYDDVVQWLFVSFRRAVEADKAVMAAFREYGQDPFALFTALALAVPAMSFSPELSNIAAIEVMIDSYSTCFRAKVKYQ